MAEKDFVIDNFDVLHNAGYSKQAIEIIQKFGMQQNITNAGYRNFIDVMSESLFLVEKFNQSVQEGRIKKLLFLESGASEGGHYDSNIQTLRVPPISVVYDSSDSNQMPFKYGLMFVMGHEIQHSFNREMQNTAISKYMDEIKKEVKKPDGERNFTAPMAGYMAIFRKDEADAQIAGYNAVLSAMRESNPDLKLDDLAKSTNRMSDFLTRGKKWHPAKFHDDYQYDSETFVIQPTDKNLEAAAHHYFDRDSKLGCQRNSNYVNHYVRSMLEIAIDADLAEKARNPSHKAPFALDMQGFKVPRIDNPNEFTNIPLNEYLIESNGLRIKSDKPVPYIDTSTGNAGYFDKMECANIEVKPDQFAAMSLSVSGGGKFSNAGGFSVGSNTKAALANEKQLVSEPKKEAVPEKETKPDDVPEPDLDF